MIQSLKNKINEDYFSKLANRKDTGDVRKENIGIEQIIKKHRPIIAKIFCDFLMEHPSGCEIQDNMGQTYSADLIHGHREFEKYLLPELVKKGIVPTITVSDKNNSSKLTTYSYEEFDIDNCNYLDYDSVSYKFDYEAENIFAKFSLYVMVTRFQVKEYNYIFDYELGKEIQNIRNNR